MISLIVPALPWVATGAAAALPFIYGAYQSVVNGKDFDRAVYDAKNATSNAVAETKAAIGKGIRAASNATSRKSYTTSNPHIDQATGRPVAVSDQTSANVSTIVLPVQPVNIELMAKPRKKGKNQPSTTPPNSGSTETPAGSTQSAASQSSPNRNEDEDENGGEDRGNSTNTSPNNPEDDKFKIAKWFWRTKSNSPRMSKWGRYGRNTLRVPIYWQVGATGLDVADHVFGRVGEAFYGKERESNANWNATKYGSPIGWAAYLATTPAKEYAPDYQETDNAVQQIVNPEDTTNANNNTPFVGDTTKIDRRWDGLY